jgi:RNA polymerase sigma factor (TIGR02999 family)
LQADIRFGYTTVMKPDAAITTLIRRAQGGDAEAAKALFESVYGDLRKMARIRLVQRRRGTLLDTTSLVHESFLRLSNLGQIRVEDRTHFLAYAAHVMRSVMVDFARHRMRKRRGGDLQRVPLSENLALSDQSDPEIVRVHDALDELKQYGERLVQVVEMRYFAGMTDAQIAEALGVTDRTVRRDWEKARVLLSEALL